MSLVISGVQKKYSVAESFKKNIVLKNVNYTLENGRVLALVGQNGAGKTTLIRCILDFVNYNKGSILFNDRKIKDIMMEGRVGYMPELMSGPELISVGEYIKDILTLRGKKFEEYKDRFEELVDRFYLMPHLDKPFSDCSKGTMKKVIFLQSIMHNPEFLVLDEPTDGLDPISRRLMLEEINQLKKKGTTVILTTHLLSDIALVADEVAVLQQGEIIARVLTDELGSNLDDWYYNVIMESGAMI